jgi:hypothetical protein
MARVVVARRGLAQILEVPSRGSSDHGWPCAFDCAQHDQEPYPVNLIAPTVEPADDCPEPHPDHPPF